MLLRRLFKVARGESASLEAEVSIAPASGVAATRAPHGSDLQRALQEADVLDLAGRHAEAIARIDEALVGNPKDAWLRGRRGLTLYRWGRVHEARQESLRAADLGSTTTELARQLGWCHLWTSDLESARRWMARAVELAPEDCHALFGMGTAALAAGEVENARSLFVRALAQAPHNVDVLNSLVVCRLDSGESVAAEAAARDVLAVDESQAMAWANLGVALARQLRFDEARPAFDRAMELEAASQDALDTFVNYCNCLRDAGRMQEAIDLYERCLPDQPNVNGHGDYAFALLTAGRLAEGFQEYEFRWMTNAFLRRYPQFDRPQWIGQDLRGKVILLWVEQGFGDTFQFVRYATAVKALGATVLLMVRDGLAEVLVGCAGIDRFVQRDGPVPHFDFHAPLMSLPRVFATDLATVPASVPYLRVGSAARDRWRARLPASTKRRVGVVWAGSPAHPNDANRSLALAALLPALVDDRAQIVVLQKGESAAQFASVAAMTDGLDLGKDLVDWSDTMAVVDQLDLIVCVDTAIAHLAGGLGKPTWILLPFPADFRWLERRTDSPWYPTARLFRQDERRDWTPVLAELRDAFQEWLRHPPAEGPRASELRFDAPAVPTESPAVRRRGFSAVARTRFGLAQFFPEAPVTGASLAIYGECRQAQVELCSVLAGMGAYVLDYHAGEGAHTLPLARAVGGSGFVQAFEPRPRFHRALRQNMSANGIVHASLLMRGLGSTAKPGSVDEQALRDVMVTGRVPETLGAVDTIDGLRLERLDLLKLAEEADAADVLAGAVDVLWRLRPRLYIAVSEARHLDRIHATVREFGYRCWRHETALYNAANFNRYPVDVFGGRAAFALVAIPEESRQEYTLAECRELA